MSLRQCWTTGTTRRVSLTRFALMTGTSTFFDNKRRRSMGRGIWFHFGKQEGNADTEEATSGRHGTAVRGLSKFQNGLFDCYFCALLRLTRQVLNARVQHLPECLKKLDA